MSTLLSVLRWATPTFYVVTVLLYVLRFLRRGERAARFARPVFWVTLVLHGLFLSTLILVNRRIPLANASEMLTVFAFAIAVAYLYVELRTRRLSTGPFVLLFPMLLQLASSARIPLVFEVPPLLLRPAFGIHTGSAILGCAAFAVSVIYGVLFLLLYRSLKETTFGLIYKRLPPLEVLSKMSIRAAVLGLASLTLAILSGSFWASAHHPGFQTDPMFLLMLLVWALYAFCVYAHSGLGWRGKPTVYLSFSGFILLGVTMLTIQTVLESFHRFNLA
jgi:HemX protein